MAYLAHILKIPSKLYELYSTYKKLPASKYAVFTASGPFSTSIGQTWMEIWQNKEIERTFTGDFELYDSKSTDDENSIVKIYVAIK